MTAAPGRRRRAVTPPKPPQLPLHLAWWVDETGKGWIATSAPWVNAITPDYVERLHNLSQTLCRWHGGMMIWLIDPRLEVALWEILGCTWAWHKRVCPQCAAANPCEAWEPINEYARKCNLGGPASSPPADRPCAPDDFQLRLVLGEGMNPTHPSQRPKLRLLPKGA